MENEWKWHIWIMTLITIIMTQYKLSMHNNSNFSWRFRCLWCFLVFFFKSKDIGIFVKKVRLFLQTSEKGEKSWSYRGEFVRDRKNCSTYCNVPVFECSNYGDSLAWKKFEGSRDRDKSSTYRDVWVSEYSSYREPTVCTLNILNIKCVFGEKSCATRF